MTELTIVVVSALVAGAFVSLVRIRRWCFGSIGRHRMWQVRDQLADDIIEGRLPADHAAVRSLLEKMHGYLRADAPGRLLQVLLFHRLVISRLPPERINQLDSEPATDGLSDHQRDLVRVHRERYGAVLALGLIAGSWLGPVLHAWLQLQRIRQRLAANMRGTSRHTLTLPGPDDLPFTRRLARYASRARVVHTNSA